MAELINQTKNQPIIKNLRIATSFSTRSKGFIGRKNLDTQEGLWFPQCNWIHTFFMSIPIDVVYLDKKMKVRKVQKNLKPWRFPAPVLFAHSVIELSVGQIDSKKIEVGDTLHVGH